ncbi:unnamed protein product [Trichobilharzia regenti]|nr:unnamed protein product [Trichobilharzia regenti]
MDASGSSARPAFTASATVLVTVLDANDNQPQFIAKGPFSILENQPRFTQVTGRLTAVDADDGENGHVSYNYVNCDPGFPDSFSLILLVILHI